LTAPAESSSTTQEETGPASAALNRKAILRKMGDLISGSAAAQALTAFTLILTARQLGIERFGQYTLCFALAGLTSVLFNLGSDHLLLRDGGRRPTRLSLLAGSTFTIKTVLGSAWLGLFVLLGPLLNQEHYPTSLLLISAGAVLLDHLLQTVLTTFKASLRTQASSVLEASTDAAWLGGTLLLVLAGNVSVESYAWVRLAVLFVGLALGITAIWRTIGLKVSAAAVRSTLSQVAPFAVSDALSLASLRQDLLIIGFALGDAAAGLYAPAVNLVNALFLVPLAAYYVMVPILGRLYATDVRQANLSARRMILMMAGIGAALALAFYLAAPFALLLLGKSYAGVTQILRILSLVLLFKCGSFAMAAIIVVTGQQSRRTLFQFFAVAANAVLNLLIVSRWGVPGVASVYVFTELLTLLGYTWIVARYGLKTKGISQSNS
jgi:O-antigen/teichoic acid export membrane protein